MVSRQINNKELVLSVLLYSNMMHNLLMLFFFKIYGCHTQVNDGIVLPDNASLHLTAIEDSEYKEDKIECKPYL